MRASSALPVLLALIAVVALTSCTNTAPYPDPRVITALQATRPADRQHGIAPFDHRGDDAAKVQRFYAVLLALPVPHGQAAPCPPGIGVVYELGFEYSDGTSAFEAQAHADGCQLVDWPSPDGHTYVVRQIDGEGFWSLLADALGVPESQIYPVLPAPLTS
jgi:hypothetical protein